MSSPPTSDESRHPPTAPPPPPPHGTQASDIPVVNGERVDNPTAYAASVTMNGRALPENDGMHSLRQKLQEIRQLAASTEEKAKQMHALMTWDYMRHRAQLQPDLDLSLAADQEAGTTAPPTDPQNPFSLRPGDLQPVYSPLSSKAKHAVDELDEEAVDEDTLELGCMHYKRNVKVQCFDCARWFPCRHCHDVADDLPFPHPLNRKKTQRMLCMLCQTPQPAGEVCIQCGEYAAWYYCAKCKLWDNDSNKRIYHCDDCGICRIGEGLGKDYVHCRRCNVCISISTSAAHPCIERATEGNCPLCLIPLFESRTSVVSLPCGHYMHGDCYQDLMAVTYKCPVCNKSAVNMELQWKKLDDEIATQPMPNDDEDDFDQVLPLVEEVHNQNGRIPAGIQPRRPRQVWVGCNDCGGRSWTPFHWLGLKCQRCDSYNTNQMAPTAVHETESERLMRQQQQIHRHDFTGNDVLLDAGIGVVESEQCASVALEVPSSPSNRPSSPRVASGAQSPGRYFVHDEESRRPSFNTSRFSTPSMPNLPTLSSLADMPRMPRMPALPNLPNLQNMRQNLPNMPNVELPRFSPAEMLDAVSRSLTPMRNYLGGMDTREYDPSAAAVVGNNGTYYRSVFGGRPMSAQSDPARKDPGGEGSRSRPPPSAFEIAADFVARMDAERWGDDEEEGSVIDGQSSGGEDSEESDDEEEEEDVEMGEGGEGEAGDGDERDEWELFGHR